MRWKTAEDERLIEDFIPRVSRTFALTIRFLPSTLRKSVYAAYLLCRAADTLEDSPFLNDDHKSERLSFLKYLLEEANAGRAPSGIEIATLYDSIDPDQGDDHRLLAKSSTLFEVLESLPADHKSIIYRWAAAMAGGMAEYAHLKGAGNEAVACLKDVEDWDKYCHYVAGTVGSMLTELFVSCFDLKGSIAERMAGLGNSFGLGLQKVNVIRDVPLDRERGLCYLPFDIMKKHNLGPSDLGDPGGQSSVAGLVNELLELTAAHLDDAISYTILMPRRHRGARMFLAVPIFLAVETVNLIRAEPVRAMAGPPVKLTRRDVGRIVNAAAFRIMSNRFLAGYYHSLKEGRH